MPFSESYIKKNILFNLLVFKSVADLFPKRRIFCVESTWQNSTNDSPVCGFALGALMVE